MSSERNIEKERNEEKHYQWHSAVISNFPCICLQVTRLWECVKDVKNNCWAAI